ncbi:methylenetetrahydrofolate reductase [Clostridia bacterium]|nr:methylenetetrahydrofolate reductase [Clostridia bacterium]
MKISSLFNKGKTVFSFEVFPPKKDSPIETIYSTLNELKKLSPDYISVTYGAGGNSADKSTREIAAYIENTLKIPAMAHLTCINAARENVLAILSDLSENGVKNILALRGDKNPSVTPKEDFKYANELISFLRESGEFADFGVSAACYPESHPESESLDADLENLKRKVDAGAETLVTQLFFDNDSFYSFCEKAAKIGVNVPISAGIMPVTSKKQIERMVTLCGASLPRKLVKLLSKYENDPISLTSAGVAYAVGQIADLISNDAAGIHLYTMNRPAIAAKITESIKSLL